MTSYGLTPEDIGSSIEGVEAAKRCWRIAWAKYVLQSMREGISAYDPAYFDWTMAELGLIPEDIGATAAQIESAKASWRAERAG